MIWKQFYSRFLGRIALYIVFLFCLVAIYAPFLAASKPFVVQYDGTWYFPLFRYLCFKGYYTKGLDIFFNLLIFTAPLTAFFIYLSRNNLRAILKVIISFIILQLSLFLFFLYGPITDPASNRQLNKERQEALVSHPLPDWNFDLQYMTDYAKLNLILNYQQRLIQQKKLEKYLGDTHLSTLWQQAKDNENKELVRFKKILDSTPESSIEHQEAKAFSDYIVQKRQWIEKEILKLHHEIMPLIRPFHWEDDAGGNQSLNSKVHFLELTRINRGDFIAALIFGVRISLVVGILAVMLSLLIGLPIGALAGFYGGTFDIIVSRLLEVWEAMPTFFILLMVVALMESKSIFLVIAVIGLFSWTSFSRYLRGEFFKQRNLPYIEACRALGFNDSRIIFSHILPNAIPPVLTLLPFAIMGAITSEAGLSFLGLGEEGSCSWGVLMDEGRLGFPNASYLLWPPAILLTILLVAIALIGDALRDALDPKMKI